MAARIDGAVPRTPDTSEVVAAAERDGIWNHSETESLTVAEREGFVYVKANYGDEWVMLDSYLIPHVTVYRFPI